MFDADRRCGEVAGLDGVRARHQRQRQARRVHRARPAARSGEGPRINVAVLRGDAEPGRRIDLGRDDRASRRGRAARAGSESAGDGARRGLQRADARLRRARRATSTAKAWCGCRSRSGHLGSFDRRKCKGPLNGPKATGDHCPEGWSFHKYPGPGFQGIGDNSAESSYYSWVDQHNTFGLGNDVPMSTGNLNDGLIAYANGRMVMLRVPYPIGFYAKGLRRPHRRSESGMERPRAVGGERRSHAVADRRRQGDASRSRRTSSCGRTRWRNSSTVHHRHSSV